MKKLLAVILSIISIFSITIIGGCNDEKDSLSFYVPDGAPALAIAKFIKDNENFGSDKEIDYHIVSSMEISTAITSLNGDFVILPVNSATKLYNANKSNKYVMSSVITHGNFYIVSTIPLENVNDLRGMIVYTPMRGKVPDLTLQYILSQANIGYEETLNDIPSDGNVGIRYFNEGADVVKALPGSSNVNVVGLLPEPASTQISKKKSAYSYKLDIQELYDSESKSYPQAVLMVSKRVASKYENMINQMGILFSENIEWVKDNTALAIDTIKQKFPSTTLDASTMTRESIENCNIYYQTSKNSKQSVKKYIENIRSIDSNCANSVGDDFFL